MRPVAALAALVVVLLVGSTAPAYAERVGGFETGASAPSSTTGATGASAPSSTTGGTGAGARYSTSDRGGKPLAGRVVVLDAGHQLGNHHYPRQINREVPAGGFRKACNTTGTATNGGYPEATFVWVVTQLLEKRLEKLGARVKLTRTSNRQDRWGPCIDERGRKGNRIPADVKLSIHADGSYTAGARGFHVIAPTDRRPWTHDIHRASKRLARDTKAALRAHRFPKANYIAGGDGLDFRADLGTLNLSDVPTVMVELGNMRNAKDAGRMTTPRGRHRYADALAGAVRRFLD